MNDMVRFPGAGVSQTLRYSRYYMKMFHSLKSHTRQRTHAECGLVRFALPHPSRETSVHSNMLAQDRFAGPVLPSLPFFCSNGLSF